LFDESYYKYRLVGVLVHSGTAESGHYYSYIRDGEKWYEFNIANLKSETFGGDDSPVRGVNDWDATSNKSRNAYLLFYERIQPI
jgi:ubiquitin C-terminal hydrolase